MVDWFDPLVLGMVGVRTLISTIIGEYADQRPMQEVVDGDKGDLLMRRHDYSVLDTESAEFDFSSRCLPGQSVPQPAQRCRDNRGVRRRARIPAPVARQRGALGRLCRRSPATALRQLMPLALLLAAEKLKVRGVTEELPAGQILIFGGDLAYPNATIEEYRNRCLQPYNCAFTIEPGSLPPRELFHSRQPRLV